MDTRDISLVERLITIKKKSGSNPWPAIEECIKVFKTRKPTHWKSHLIQVEDLRQSRKDPKYASTHDKATGGYLRYTLDIPSDIIYLINALYSPAELPMNKQFFIEFAKRYPELKVAQKL